MYADWEQIKDTNITIDTFKSMQIGGVTNSGIKLGSYFVPCYNRQNGYYSDALDLVIIQDGKKISLDITKYKDNDENY